MPRPGTRKIDFYPDVECWEILQNLPTGSRNAVINNVIKIQLSQDASLSMEAQTNLADLLRLRASSPNHSFPQAAYHAATIASNLALKHNIEVPERAVNYLALMFLQQVRFRSLSLEELGTDKGNLNLDAAFFKAIADTLDWEKILAKPIRVAGVEVLPDAFEDEDMEKLQTAAKKKLKH